MGPQRSKNIRQSGKRCQKYPKKDRKSTSNIGSKCLTPNILHVLVDYRKHHYKKIQFFIKKNNKYIHDKGPSIAILSIQKIQNS